MRYNGTKIYCGFPAVGKSETYKSYHKDYRLADSDSSHFSWIINNHGEKIRNPDFPRNYIEHIKELINLKYDYIFVSTHKEVINALIEANLKFAIIYPDSSLKDEYLRRYKERGSDDSFIQLINSNWYNFIRDIENTKATSKFKLMYSFKYLSSILEEEHNDYHYYSYSSNYYPSCCDKWSELQNYSD